MARLGPGHVKASRCSPSPIPFCHSFPLRALLYRLVQLSNVTLPQAELGQSLAKRSHVATPSPDRESSSRLDLMLHAALTMAESSYLSGAPSIDNGFKVF